MLQQDTSREPRPNPQVIPITGLGILKKRHGLLQIEGFFPARESREEQGRITTLLSCTWFNCSRMIIEEKELLRIQEEEVTEEEDEEEEEETKEVEEEETL